MIDHTLITSGFDLEVLLGAEFFKAAMSTLFDAGLVPEEQNLLLWDIRVARPAEAEIVFRDVTVYSKDDPPVTQPADLRLRFPVELEPKLERDPQTLYLNTDIFLQLKFPEQTNSTTGLVDRVGMKIVYLSMDDVTRQRLRDEGQRRGVEDLDLLMEEQLRPLIDRDMGDQLIPIQKQKMAVRKFLGHSGAQACFAVYVNLPLKLGPLFDTTKTDLPLYVLPPEPDDQPVDRGEAGRGQNFLPLDRDIALGAPPDIYARLVRHQLHMRTMLIKDRWKRPLLDGDEVKGHITGLSIKPAAVLSGVTVRQLLRVKVNVNLTQVDIDASVVIDIIPVITPEGALDIDVHVHEPEADTSFWEGLLFAVGLILAVPSLFVGLGMVAGIGLLTTLPWGMLRLIKEEQEAAQQTSIEQQFAGSKDGLVAFLSAIPSRLTIVPKRVDPFYQEAYQVVTTMHDMQLHAMGLSFAGTVTTGMEEQPLGGVIPVSRIRESEPAGVLKRLIYQVPSPETVLDVDRFERPDPQRYPNRFALAPQEAKERKTRNHLRNAVIRPVQVLKRSGRVAEILFDTWIGLAPFEAGELQLHNVLSVAGYQLIRPRNGRPYYRDDADANPSNNLASLPTYVSYQSRMRAKEVQDVTRAIQQLADTSNHVYWNTTLDGQPQSVAAVIYHLSCAYEPIGDLIEAVATGNPPPALTWQDLDGARFNVLGEPDDLAQEYVATFTWERSQRLEQRIAAITDRALYKGAHVPLLNKHVTTAMLVEALKRYMWERFDLAYRQVEAFRQRKG